ncbi:hypothetical protein OIU78_025198, partial [Salix suchowensis]
MREKIDLLREKLMRIEYEDGNRLLPKVHLDDKVFTELCYPWCDALIVKLLGKNIGYTQINIRLKKVSHFAKGFELMDVGHGFFMVKFDQETDRMK